jgi:hypothetical protein
MILIIIQFNSFIYLSTCQQRVANNGQALKSAHKNYKLKLNLKLTQ